MNEAPLLHRITIHYHVGICEWIAYCDCGWVGSHFSLLRSSSLEANAHLVKEGC